MTRKRYRVKGRFYVILAILLCFVFGMVAYFFLLEEGEKPAFTIQSEEGFKIMMSARAYISNENLRYEDTYFAGGYPPDDIGVCTDVVWKGFLGIDVSVKDLVDVDTFEARDRYDDVISIRDPNIDFRLVPQLERFFERHSEVLTTDLQLDSFLLWQAGDIVTFESSHVAVVSSFRNLWGRPYIIQHGKDPAAEEDRIYGAGGMEISGHFRWTKQCGSGIGTDWEEKEVLVTDPIESNVEMEAS